MALVWIVILVVVTVVNKVIIDRLIHKNSYVLASDSEGKVTRAYNVLQLPTTFILNKEGEIIREIRNVANKGVLTVFLNGIIERN